MNTVQTQKWQTRFFTIWTGQALSLISSELVQFALVWWLTEVAGSASVVAMGTLVALLPRAFLSPVAGALVDRWNRRLVMIVADGLIALSLAWLGFLLWMGAAQVWHVYVVMFVRAIGTSFHMPAMFASTALMVPEKHLSRVAGMNEMAYGAVMVFAPPVGALLMSLMPLSGIIAIDVVGALLAIVPLLFIRIPQPRRSPAYSGESTAIAGLLAIWSDVRAGVRYMRDWPGAVGMLTLSTSINFLSRPAFLLTSILVARHFGGTEDEFGWMGAAFGAGIMTGGLVLSVWGGFRRRMQTSLMGVVGMGLGILAIGLAPQSALQLALGGMFAGGFMVPMCMGPIKALVQSEVEPSMQGRVFTIMESVSTAISPLSLAVAGPIFDRWGPQAWYVWGGIAAVLIGLKGFITPSILNLGAPGAIESHTRGVKTLTEAN